MKMTIQPIKIKEDPRNEVTSEKLFHARKIKDGDRFLFHEDGIFSEKIFGKFNKCYCGSLTKPGYCEKCKCRVLDKRHVPDFYIKFEFDLPNRAINYQNQGDVDSNIIEGLLKCKGFLYDGNYIEFNLENMKITDYEDQSKIKIGKEAILSLGISEEWYNQNVHRLVSIPHTSYRQITIQNGQYIVGPLNIIYMRMIRLNNRYKEFKANNVLSIFNEINLRYMINEGLEELYEELFEILAKQNRSVIDSELKGQPETGMIRAVMTNNFSLEEDTLLIGYYFISTLYPRLYAQYTDQYGITDIKGLNEELEREEYYVLFNRQPTIGAKSIIAMKPKFSEKDAEMFVIQANPIVYDGLAADVDGDSLNVIALYSKEANKEAKKLLASRNYLEGSNGSIRNGILEEFDYVQTKLENE